MPTIALITEAEDVFNLLKITLSTQQRQLRIHKEDFSHKSTPLK